MHRLAVLLLAACGSEPTVPPPIRFLHTFNPEVTELFNTTMAERGLAVESALVPFARGRQVISEIVASGTHCPDLIRIDATWLPALAEHLVPVPDDLRALDWLPEAGASELAVPQSFEGLLVIRDKAAPAPASSRIADLVAAARAAKYSERPYPLGLRVDGYVFVPWLRAHGGELAPGGLDGDGAVAALDEFAGLFGDLVPPPPAQGNETPDEVRRWNDHDIAYWVAGPWQIGGLNDRERIEVSALDGAPRGGPLLVVPKCAKRPADGWRLAREMTSPAFALELARTFVTVPTRVSTLASAPPLVQTIYHALQGARPLVGSPITPLLFDDLNPAIAAVVTGDATAAEAIAGARRGWKRVLR